MMFKKKAKKSKKCFACFERNACTQGVGLFLLLRASGQGSERVWYQRFAQSQKLNRLLEQDSLVQGIGVSFRCGVRFLGDDVDIRWGAEEGYHGTGPSLAKSLNANVGFIYMYVCKHINIYSKTMCTMPCIEIIAEIYIFKKKDALVLWYVTIYEQYIYNNSIYTQAQMNLTTKCQLDVKVSIQISVIADGYFRLRGQSSLPFHKPVSNLSRIHS
jgi:hypothetical protein